MRESSVGIGGRDRSALPTLGPLLSYAAAISLSPWMVIGEEGADGENESILLRMTFPDPSLRVMTANRMSLSVRSRLLCVPARRGTFHLFPGFTNHALLIRSSMPKFSLTRAVMLVATWKLNSSVPRSTLVMSHSLVISCEVVPRPVAMACTAAGLFTTFL